MHDRGAETGSEARVKLLRAGPHAYNNKIWPIDPSWEALHSKSTAVSSALSQPMSCVADANKATAHLE